MKIFYLLATTFIFSAVVNGQLESTNVTIEDPHLRTKSEVWTKSTNCGIDTNQYAMFKSTSLQMINVNNATSGYALGQYFDAPQPLEISGADFYAYKPDLTNGSSMIATVYVYSASVDSLPTGSPLATTTVSVDTSFGGGQLDILRKSAVFSSPITVNNPYIVVVENNSSTPMSVVNNDYQAFDGGQEWLSSINIGGTWLRSYDVSVGGDTFDADILVEPYISHDLTASFTHDAGCLTGAETVNFTNTSSPILQNRMYNLAESLGLTELSYTYNYGDGTPEENLIDPSHAYTAAGPYSVTLIDTIYGWTRDCAADTVITLGTQLIADFSSAENGFQIDFTDLSVSNTNITDWSWDFGDGGTSTQENPTYTYASAGSFTVCLTVTNSCSTDSICETIEITCTDPTADFTSTINDLDVSFTDASISSTSINAWSWDFGDGNTSTQINPTHTYANDGGYTVCLLVTDSCSTDTTCQTINVSDGTSGIIENEKDNIQVYPNPMSDDLNFTFETIPSQVVFITVTGQKVTTINPTEKETSVNVSTWTDGIYFVQFEFQDGSIVTQKIIKN